jgi:hypothetical protein
MATKVIVVAVVAEEGAGLVVDEIGAGRPAAKVVGERTAWSGCTVPGALPPLLAWSYINDRAANLRLDKARCS